MRVHVQRNVAQCATDTKVKKKETLEVSGSANGTNAGSEMECAAGAVRAWVWRSNDGGVMEQGFSRTLNIGRTTSELCT
jgi:hypothetical protein